MRGRPRVEEKRGKMKTRGGEQYSWFLSSRKSARDRGRMAREEGALCFSIISMGRRQVFHVGEKTSPS